MSTEKLIGQYGVKVFQAPIWHPKLKKLPVPVNCAEILFRFGYLNEEWLFDIVMGWKNLFEIIAPVIEKRRRKIYLCREKSDLKLFVTP